MEIPIFKEIVIIFTLSIGVLLACHRLKLPAVVGFLLTGILCGPHGLGLVGAIDDVQNLATIGIVLLLFTVGMEFSIKNIIKYKYFFFGGGILQVLLTITITFLISLYLMGRPWNESIFLGFLISLSSTAIVLRALEENGESESPQGRLILGILIFQDIIAVPMMLMVPLLAESGDEFNNSNFYEFLYGISVLIAMAIFAFYAVPWLLYFVTRTRNRELFLLSVLTICFVVAWITSSIGLSLSLGAFLAGLIVSESDYSDEAVGNVLPFQEIFTSFFFVSMGMLLDVGFVIHQPLLIIGIAMLVIFVKASIASGSALILGMPLRSAIIGGIALSQVGEFSFVVAHSGISLGLVSDYGYQLFLAVSLLTMGITPTCMHFSTHIASLINRFPLNNRIKNGLQDEPTGSPQGPAIGHVIICGFGLRGRHIARAAKAAGVSYVILELNPETVKSEKSNGEPIRYGDPSHPSVLAHVGVKAASAVAVVINDPIASKQIVKVARSLNPNVYIVTRTRYFQEVPLMLNAGADDVIPDEFGSSLEIFTRILQKAKMPAELIYRYVDELRNEGYEALGLNNNQVMHSLYSLNSADAKIETLNVKEGSVLIGKTVLESELKKAHGLTVLLIKRQNRTITTIHPETDLQAADSVVLFGSNDSLEKAKNLF
jgi:CPA2 family monovalent cation:H+ antiporter-2